MTSKRIAVALAVACSGWLLATPGCTPSERAASDAPPEKPVPEVVRRMIDAHGGMEPWRAAPSVRFTERWGDGPAVIVTVEQGRRRVYQEMAGADTRLGWDGERAWSVGFNGPPPRFLAQLNYYFLNLPWLTMDPGVLLGEPGTGRLWDDPTEYATVMMTFEGGVGDTPDDYYELYVHPETHRLAACRYTVTYRALLPPGAEKTPDHLLVYEAYETVNGLVMPTRFTIYGMDHAVLAKCTVSDWAFDQPFDATRAAMPEGAVVDTTTP